VDNIVFAAAIDKIGSEGAAVVTTPSSQPILVINLICFSTPARCVPVLEESWLRGRYIRRLIAAMICFLSRLLIPPQNSLAAPSLRRVDAGSLSQYYIR
jgi:hypothetical protein